LSLILLLQNENLYLSFFSHIQERGHYAGH